MPFQFKCMGTLRYRTDIVVDVVTRSPGRCSVMCKLCVVLLSCAMPNTVYSTLVLSVRLSVGLFIFVHPSVAFIICIKV